VQMADETGSEQHLRNSFGAQIERLDKLVRAIYERGFEEFVNELFRHAYLKGFETGERKGFTAGRRSAKGLKGDAKKRGRPPIVEKGVRTLHARHVEQGKQNGKTVSQSTREFLKIMRIGEKAIKGLAKQPAAARLALPSEKQAMQAYYRDRRKGAATKSS
jgi:hypothetical protein